MVPPNLVEHYGILGILCLFDKELFLLVITHVTNAGSCPRGKKIYQISSVEALPFFQKPDSDGKKDPHLKGILKLIEEQNFYFSYFTDLTNNQENLSKNRAAYRESHPGQKKESQWWRYRKQPNEMSKTVLTMKQEEQKSLFDKDDSFLGELPMSESSSK